MSICILSFSAILFVFFQAKCDNLNLFLMFLECLINSKRSVLEYHSRSSFWAQMNLKMNSSLKQFSPVSWLWLVFLFECKAAKLKVQWTLRVSNRRDQQVFHLAAVQIEWVMRLRLLWRVVYALASVSSSYKQKIAFESERGSQHPKAALVWNSSHRPNSLLSLFLSGRL